MSREREGERERERDSSHQRTTHLSSEGEKRREKEDTVLVYATSVVSRGVEEA